MSGTPPNNAPVASQVQSVIGKLDRAVKLLALRLDSPEARRLGTELYYEVLHLAVSDSGFTLEVGESGLIHDGELVLAADAAPWAFNLWTAGFRHIVVEPGLEESELIWFLELLSDEERQDLAWRAWARNLSQIRFRLAPLPALSREMDVELSHLVGLLEVSGATTPRSDRVEVWSEEALDEFIAPDPKLRHNIVRELQAETMPFMGQRLLLRLLEMSQSTESRRREGFIEDLGWVLWHFAHQSELRASGRVLRDLQQLCHDAGLTEFGEDTLAKPEAHADAVLADPASAARERIDRILAQEDVSHQDVEELLRQAEISALSEAGVGRIESEEEVETAQDPVFRPYKGIKFTVSAGPTRDPSSATRDRRRDSGFWKIDTDSAGDDVIDSLFSEVFGEEEPEPPRAAPRPAEAPEVVPYEVEESSIDLSALGFDPALLLKKPASAAAPQAAAAPPAPGAPAPAARRTAGQAEPEPERPELLWADMDLGGSDEEAGSSETAAKVKKSLPIAQESTRAGVSEVQLAETQKLRLEDIRAAARAQRTPALAPPQTAEPVSRARVLRAQGRLVEARHLLHRYIKDAPEDPAAEDEFRMIQRELRAHFAHQLRNEELVPQLQLPAGSPHLQALLQAPAGGVLRRVNGSASLREIRSQMQLEPGEFESQMTSLLEWGFVTLASRKR
jgi:hypothetical protein